ncbi:MAG: beta-galactosidase, partial [Acidimicrobiia bacterium]
MTLTPVSLTGRYAVRDGRPFIPIGAHWVPAVEALSWPLEWNEESIEADFQTMKDLGYNIVRIDLFWAWFEPRPGSFNEEAFSQIDHLIELCHRFEIYLHPTLFIGGEVGEAYWDVPWRDGRHPHADPEMLRLQAAHASEFARRYAGEPAILAWDLTDEPPFWIVGSETTDAMAVEWTRCLSEAIRKHDPGTPICVGTADQDLLHGPFRPDMIVDHIDFLSVHPYPIYAPQLFPDPLLSERVTYCSAFQVVLSAGAGKAAMVHELGASSAQYDPQRIALFDRVSMYSALGNGTNGLVLWCHTDAAPETFERLPYLRAPHETQFGLTTWDRKHRPAGSELREMSSVLDQMDLADIDLASADAALVVPYEWSKPYGDFSRSGLAEPQSIPYASVQDVHTDGNAALNEWLMGALLSTFINGRRAGLAVAMPREYSDLDRYPMLLLPSPVTSTEYNLVHLHTTFWKTAEQYVRDGGSIYASVCADAAIPEMHELFGAILADHTPVDTVELTIVEPIGSLEAGETFSYKVDPRNVSEWPAIIEPRGGTIVAVDADGRPAIIANQHGSGHTLLSAFPLECYQARTPNAFSTGEPTHRLYRALAEWSGITPFMTTDQPSVEVGILSGDHEGYAVVTRHTAATAPVTVACRE